MANDNPLASGLAQLGANISGIYQNVALQNQYRNSLPAMQQTFQSAMEDFDAGKSGSGFSKIMSVAMENPTNPFIQNMSMMAMKAGEMASNDYMSKMKASGTGGGISPEVLEAFKEFGGEGGLPAAAQPTGAAMTRDQIEAKAAAELPSLGEPVAEVPSFEVDEAYTPAEGEQIIETPWLKELGLNVAAVVGPKEYSVKEAGELTKSMSIGPRGASATKSQKEEIIKKNKEEAAEFKSVVDEARSAAQSFKSNAQLKRILNDSGRDFTNIEIDEDVDEFTGKTSYKALVTKADGSVSEEPLTEAEAGKLKVFKEKIPEFSERAGIRIIKPKPQATEAAAEEATGGMPEVQAQRTSVYETKGLREELKKEQAAESKKSGKERQDRINEINKEIKSLQRGTTQRYTGAGLPGAGAMATTGKTQREIERDIAKIEQLVSERSRLMGKTTAPSTDRNALLRQADDILGR
jgi:hypothetical protein